MNASYQLTAAHVPEFYVRFRNDDLTSYTHGFFRDAVRNAFRLSTAYRAEDINGARQTELIDRVADQLCEAVKPYGVDVLQLGFASPPRPPDSVKQAIDAAGSRVPARFLARTYPATRSSETLRYC